VLLVPTLGTSGKARLFLAIENLVFPQISSYFAFPLIYYEKMAVKLVFGFEVLPEGIMLHRNKTFLLFLNHEQISVSENRDAEKSITSIRSGPVGNNDQTAN